MYLRIPCGQCDYTLFIYRRARLLRAFSKRITQPYSEKQQGPLALLKTSSPCYLQACEGLVLVAVRIVLLPVPCVAAHLLDAILSLPIQLLLCLCGVAVAGGNISGTTGF